MLRLEHGKSYLWLFAVYGVLFLGGFALGGALGNASWGILTLPACIAFLLACELRSGVALDSWWRAVHLKGRWQYQALLAWHAAGVVLFSIFSYFFIH